MVVILSTKQSLYFFLKLSSPTQLHCRLTDTKQSVIMEHKIKEQCNEYNSNAQIKLFQAWKWLEKLECKLLVLPDYLNANGTNVKGNWIHYWEQTTTWYPCRLHEKNLKISQLIRCQLGIAEKSKILLTPHSDKLMVLFFKVTIVMIVNTHALGWMWQSA